MCWREPLGLQARSFRLGVWAHALIARDGAARHHTWRAQPTLVSAGPADGRYAWCGTRWGPCLRPQALAASFECREPPPTTSTALTKTLMDALVLPSGKNRMGCMGDSGTNLQPASVPTGVVCGRRFIDAIAVRSCM